MSIKSYLGKNWNKHIKLDLLKIDWFSSILMQICKILNAQSVSTTVWEEMNATLGWIRVLYSEYGFEQDEKS